MALLINTFRRCYRDANAKTASCLRSYCIAMLLSKESRQSSARTDFLSFHSGLLLSPFSRQENVSNLKSTNDTKNFNRYLDRQLKWKQHVSTKRIYPVSSKQLRLKLNKMYWRLGGNSQLTLENKILLYKTIPKSSWIYNIQLWSTAASTSRYCKDINQRSKR